MKDDRIRRPLSFPVIFYRLLLRLPWSFVLLILSLPGLLLWLPIFAVTRRAVAVHTRSGPAWDTFDEIAQHKLVYGLFVFVCVWCGTILLTLPLAVVTAPLVPALMWMSLRWFEDAVSAFRAAAALLRMLLASPTTLARLRAERASIHSRLHELAVNGLGLPRDPETYFTQSGERQKGRVTGHWAGRAKYFSVRRRRKRDWNETLRLHEQFDWDSDNS